MQTVLSFRALAIGCNRDGLEVGREIMRIMGLVNVDEEKKGIWSAYNSARRKLTLEQGDVPGQDFSQEFLGKHRSLFPVRIYAIA